MEAEAALPVPDDALADILGRLPPRSLAASRCVCKAWRALVDARGLLLRHVLPHALRGIFINYCDYEQPLFFARPSSEFPPVSSDLGYVPGFGPHYGTFIDHCNGLLLYPGDSGYYVIKSTPPRGSGNPSRTLAWTDTAGTPHVTCLVFDPAVSPHYEVFCIPLLPRPDERGVRQEHVPPTSSSFNLGRLFSSDDDDTVTVAMEAVEEEQRVLEELARPPPPPSLERGFFPSRELSLSARRRLGKPDDPYGSMEWPQSLCTLHVFSSSTRRWEERQFVREGDPVGTNGGGCTTMAPV
ncbi:unnamed protein product [Urochloa decumbens]|uniref:F-box domain-containing protein n=1 Tax=Urochloa decumbens TaxID=240449 RepID=A0ABC8X9S4_9POAL